MKYTHFYLIPLILASSIPQNILKNHPITSKDRILTKYNPLPFRLKADFSKIISSDNDDVIKQRIQQIVIGATQFISTILQVNHPEESMTLNYDGFDQQLQQELQECVTIPDEYKNQEVVDTDLILFVGFKNEENIQYLAYASAIQQSQDTGRPQFGYIIFNLAFLQDIQEDPNQFQNQLQTTVHEIFHVLGFSSDLFSDFINPSTKVKLVPSIIKEDKENYSLIKLPLVLEAAKKHFGCGNLQGVPLEDDGSDGSKGSHWETSILKNDIMTAASRSNMIISKITLKLLENSGWYKIITDEFESTNWGQDKGCNFITGQCNTQFAEYCEEPEENEEQNDLIDFFMQSYGKCQKSQFDDCYTVEGYKNINCTMEPEIAEDNQAQKQFNEDTYQVFSKDSILVKSTIINKSKANSYTNDQHYRCYKYSLKDDDTVTITLSNNKQFDCNLGQQIDITEDQFEGTIVCPNNEIKTLYRSICKDSCSMAGYCYNSKCYCFDDAIQIDDTCSCGQNCIQCQINEQQKFTCSKCSLGTYLNEQKKCQPNIICSDNIALCKLCENATECFSCEEGAYFISDKKTCESNCREKGYFTNEENKICVKCIPYCESCDINNTCEKCQLGFIKHYNQCIEEDQCPGTVYQNKCVTCNESCKTCFESGKNSCLSCQNSHFLLTNTNTCHSKCPKQSISKEVVDLGIQCTVCAQWIYEDDCYSKCPDGTYQIPQTDDDLEDYGIQLQANSAYGKCEDCEISFCKMCQKDKSQCEKCQDGYYSNDNSCEKCMAQCKNCENEMNCSSCEDDKELIKLLNGKIVCTKICENFEQRNSKLECIVCEIQLCKQCEDDGKKCKKCNENYNLIDGKCTDEAQQSDEKDKINNDNDNGKQPEQVQSEYEGLLEYIALILLIIE